MTERLFEGAEKEINSIRALSERLILGYLGRVDLDLAFRQPKTFSFDHILAENYPILPDLVKKDLRESGILVQRKVALALARTGDLSLVNELLEGADDIKWLVDAAGLQFQNGADNSQTHQKALNLIGRKNESDYNLIENYSTVVKSMFETNQDTTKYLQIMGNIVERKKGGKYFPESEIGQYANTLAFCEKYDQALSCLEDLSISPSRRKYFHNQIYQQRAKRDLQKGEVDEAVKSARTITDMRVYLTVVNDILSYQIKNRQKPSFTLEEIERLAGSLKEEESHIILRTLVTLTYLAKSQGQDPKIYEDKIASQVQKSNAYEEQIKIQAEVARIKKESGEDIKPMFDSIREKVERLYSEANGDKLNYLEAMMAAEEAIYAAIDIGYYETARDLIKLYVAKDLDPPEELGPSDMVADLYAGLAMTELREGIKDKELQDLSKQDLQKLLKANDQKLHEAIGYFDLLDETDLKNLRPEATISVSLGRMKKTGEIVEKQEMIDQARLSLRASLHQELSRDPNSPEAMRIMRSLIELKDEEGREAAAQFVTNEVAPPHLRIYWARKLCESGFWDRELISYFRSYKAEADQQGLIRDVRLESLSAIVTQMHQTPTLALYKVYERTRLAKDREALGVVADFGNNVLLLPALDMKEKLAVFGFWSERYERGLIDEAMLHQVKENLAELAEAERRFLLIHGIDPDKKTNARENVHRLYTSETITSYFTEIDKLLKMGTFPTPVLIEFLVNNPESGIEWLRLQKTATEDGRFDPNNLIQRDLEFTKFLSLSKAPLETAYKNFGNSVFTETGLNYVEKKRHNP